MAFWKKSEDPWDIDPSKKKREPSAYTVPEEAGGLEEKPEDESFFAEVAGLFKRNPTRLRNCRP